MLISSPHPTQDQTDTVTGVTDKNNNQILDASDDVRVENDVTYGTVKAGDFSTASQYADVGSADERMALMIEGNGRFTHVSGQLVLNHLGYDGNSLTQLDVKFIDSNKNGRIDATDRVRMPVCDSEGKILSYEEMTVKDFILNNENTTMSKRELLMGLVEVARNNFEFPAVHKELVKGVLFEQEHCTNLPNKFANFFLTMN